MLATERELMFFVLSLIIIIAAFNIVTSLFILVQNKNREIAVLKTIGCSDSSILRIFLLSVHRCAAAGVGLWPYRPPPGGEEASTLSRGGASALLDTPLNRQRQPQIRSVVAAAGFAGTAGRRPLLPPWRKSRRAGRSARTSSARAHPSLTQSARARARRVRFS